jgi:hypothetical protein
MNVIMFPRSESFPCAWRQTEINKIVAGSSNWLSSGEASGWDISVTEAGDPQFYLLGPAPEYHCVLTVTRLGGRYILEDGVGRVLFEHLNLDLLTTRVRSALRVRNTARFLGQMLVVGCAVRTVFEERVETILAEPMEILTHFAPQLAAFA